MLDMNTRSHKIGLVTMFQSLFGLIV